MGEEPARTALATGENPDPGDDLEVLKTATALDRLAEGEGATGLSSNERLTRERRTVPVPSAGTPRPAGMSRDAHFLLMVLRDGGDVEPEEVEPWGIRAYHRANPNTKRYPLEPPLCRGSLWELIQKGHVRWSPADGRYEPTAGLARRCGRRDGRA